MSGTVDQSGDIASLGQSKNTSAPVEEDEEVPKKKPTEFQPFNLTKPKPKMIPLPEAIKREVKANPVPKMLYKKTLAEIEAEKEARRHATVNAVKKEYEQNTKKPFELATQKLPSTKRPEEIAKELEQFEKSKLKFEGTKPREMPDFNKKSANVKLNVAALKREKHMLDKQEAEEHRLIAEMAMGLKDSSEFNRW